MRLSGRPLLAAAADQALLVGRDDAVAAIERAVDRGLSVLVHGDRGSGRTSVLRAVQHRLGAGSDIDVGFVRPAGLSTVADVLVAVLDALEPGPGAELDPGADVRAALGALAQLASTRRRLVLLDDLDPTVGNRLFGVLRDELWETRTQWVVTALDDQVTTLLRPPADAFFEVRVALPPLSASDAVELLRRRLPEVADESLAVLAADGGQPRRLLDLARELAATGRLDDGGAAGVDDLVAARRAWDDRLAALGRPAAMLAAELQRLGPVSASDAALLDRLGWTRPRAVQVLTSLERAGLADSAPLPSSGPGRPKKVYRLLSPAEVLLHPTDGAEPDAVTRPRARTSRAKSRR